MNKLTLLVLMMIQNNLINNPYFKYRFVDSSVPPKYHRSYEIVVTSKKIRFVVDSYGEVLYEEEIPNTQEKFSKFEKELKAFDIKLVKEKYSNGCTGGTSNHFEARFSNGLSIKGYEYKCGGVSYGTIKGDIDGVIKYFQNMIPNFKEKMEKLQ